MSQSPVVRALLAVGLECLKERTSDELDELKQTPLGYLVREIAMRQMKIKAEGRKATSEDAAAFIEEIPAIVRYAREQEERPK